jgi:hypothetical protein
VGIPALQGRVVRLFRINTGRSPINMDGELEKGITIDIPSSMAECTIFLYLGFRSSSEGSIIPIR